MSSVQMSIAEAQVLGSIKSILMLRQGLCFLRLENTPKLVTDKKTQRTIPVKSDQRGWPDLLVCYRGWFIALEVKRAKGGVLEAHQHEILEMVSECGGIAAAVSSFQQVNAILDYVDKNMTQSAEHIVPVQISRTIKVERPRQKSNTAPNVEEA